MYCYTNCAEIITLFHLLHQSLENSYMTQFASSSVIL